MTVKLRRAGVNGRLLLTPLTLVVALVAGEAHGAQLTASWVDNTRGVATTRVERRLGTDTLYAPIADVPPGVTAYVDATVRSGTTYCYRTFAYDAAGVSPYSNEACGTSGDDALQVTVSKTGAGAGTVASTPAGILCGTACSATYPAGIVVTLAATPAIGSAFTGWSGSGCAGTGTCTLAGNAPVMVTAGFSLVTYPVTVIILGPGMVTSTPVGIACGPECSAAYPSGTVLTLTAAPAHPGTEFSGWSGGGCSEASTTCVITVETTVVVAALFHYGLGRQ